MAYFTDHDHFPVVLSLASPNPKSLPFPLSRTYAKEKQDLVGRSARDQGCCSSRRRQWRWSSFWLCDLKLKNHPEVEDRREERSKGRAVVLLTFLCVSVEF